MDCRWLVVVLSTLALNCAGATLADRMTPDEFTLYVDDSIEDGSLTNHRSPSRSQDFDGGRRAGLAFTYYTGKRRRLDRDYMTGAMDDFWKRGARMRVEDNELTLRLRPEGKPDETAKFDPGSFLSEPTSDNPEDSSGGGALETLGKVLGVKPPDEDEGAIGQLVWVLTILAAVAALEAGRRYLKSKKKGEAAAESVD